MIRAVDISSGVAGANSSRPVRVSSEARTTFGTRIPLETDGLDRSRLVWCAGAPHTLLGMDATTQLQRNQSATRYSRRDAFRILHLNRSQVAHWERSGLVVPREHYSFKDLGELRTLRDLCARRVSLRSIREHVEAMQRSSGMASALGESAAFGHGSRMLFRVGGALLDPRTQQLAFDFGAGGASGAVLHVMEAAAETPQRGFAIQQMFLQAVRLEETENTRTGAAELYEEILDRQPGHAASAINLGTIRYGQRNFAEAERLYRAATIADPEYALAFFDLGNVLDEMKRLDDAIVAYRRAINLVPEYADAHYNLALAYERQGERRRALRHWLMYVRLDPVGPWASHAKGQARKILSGERLTIVSRRGCLVAS